MLNYYELELRDIDDFKELLTSDVEYNRQLLKHLGITNDIPEDFYNNHYFMYQILNAVLLYKRFNLFHITPTGYYYFDQYIINLENDYQRYNKQQPIMQPTVDSVMRTYQLSLSDYYARS